jgi:hypothetical protein
MYVQVRIDNAKVESGSLEEDWDILPPKEINDPAQSKPKDWVDAKTIADPEVPLVDMHESSLVAHHFCHLGHQAR